MLITAHTNLEFCPAFGPHAPWRCAGTHPAAGGTEDHRAFTTRLGPLLRHHRVLMHTGRTRDTRCRQHRLPDQQIYRPSRGWRRAASARRGPATADTATADWPLCTLDDDAYVHHTSGSTAAPRGVVITQRNLPSNMRNGRGLNSSIAVMSWAAGCPCTMTRLVRHSPHSGQRRAVFTTPHRFLYDPLGFSTAFTSSGLPHVCAFHPCSEWLINAYHRRARRHRRHRPTKMRR